MKLFSKKQQTYYNISQQQSNDSSPNLRTGEVRSKELRIYKSACNSHLLHFCYPGLFSFFLLHIVLHKTFFFGECKREVIEEVVVCCSTLSLSVFVKCEREKKQILMWYLAPIHSFVQHLLLITSRILYKKYQRL